MQTYFSSAIPDVLEKLNTNLQRGLSDNDAHGRLISHGSNSLKEQETKNPFSILWDQLTETLVVILIIAAFVSFLLGEIIDAVTITVIVILNTILGATQEFRAEKAMAALKKLSVANVKVLRDRSLKELPATDLVPGDIIILEAGTIVPADCRLAQTSLLKIQEAALTGESEPVEKLGSAVLSEDASLGDRVNMAFMGTMVTNGRGTAIVTDTGMNTVLGKIASMIQSVEREPTPLQQRLDILGKNLAAIAFILVAVVFFAGMLRGQDFHVFLSNARINFSSAFLHLLQGNDIRLMFLTAVSLAVAAVPEGLPAVVTIALALGARRMLARHALIRKLPAVETLGSVTTICSDKTGTLTENRMTVTILDVAGHRLDIGSDNPLPKDSSLSTPAIALLLAGGALCNDAVLMETDGSSTGIPKISGDPTENALVYAALRFGLNKHSLDSLLPRIAEIPFDSERKRMTTVHIPSMDISLFPEQIREALELAFCSSCRSYVVTKGAIDSLIPVCTSLFVKDDILAMDNSWRNRVDKANSLLASNGMRVLGLAFKGLDTTPDRNRPGDLENDLTFIGLTAMIDPPRPEVRNAVLVCKNAGIRPVMITGDHPITAAYIANVLGIEGSNDTVLTGSDLNRMNDPELSRHIDSVSVFARVSPEHKLRIITALQDKGNIVAMTGDGVNDAPALRKADIGVAMGITGTDVSKEAADMVLLDDNFATIVAAVSEGRVIYDNIKKFFKYLMTSNSAEIWVMLLSPFIGMPLALVPLQILWINLVTDGLPALALGVERPERNTMNRHPYLPNESVFARGIGIHIIWVGILMAAVPLVTGYIYWHQHNPSWQTMLFTILTFSQFAHALAIRSHIDSTFRIGFFSNKAIISAILLSIGLQFILLYYPPLRTVFSLKSLPLSDVLLCLVLSTIVFWAVEIEKLIKRHSH